MQVIMIPIGTPFMKILLHNYPCNWVWHLYLWLGPTLICIKKMFPDQLKKRTRKNKITEFSVAQILYFYEIRSIYCHYRLLFTAKPKYLPQMLMFLFTGTNVLVLCDWSENYLILPMQQFLLQQQHYVWNLIHALWIIHISSWLCTSAFGVLHYSMQFQTFSLAVDCKDILVF